MEEGRAQESLSLASGNRWYVLALRGEDEEEKRNLRTEYGVKYCRITNTVQVNFAGINSIFASVSSLVILSYCHDHF